MHKVFIAGAGRSGTSLLHSLVGSHPEVISIPETSLIRRYILNRLSSCSSREILSDPKLERLGISYDIETKLSSSNATPLETVESIFELYYSVSSEALCPKPRYLCDKDPLYSLKSRALFQLYPDSYLVHIVRDPVDVVYSRTQADWSRNHGILRSALITSVTTIYCHVVARYFFKDKYFLIEYESLITKPEITLGNLFDRLMLSRINLQMIESSRKYISNTLVSPSEMQWKGKVLSPIDGMNSGNGHSSLTYRQRLVIYIICFPYYLLKLFLLRK
jgi:hypothetical protein